MKSNLQNRTMFYAEPVYRPPSEAYSLLIQATESMGSPPYLDEGNRHAGLEIQPTSHHVSRASG